MPTRTPGRSTSKAGIDANVIPEHATVLLDRLSRLRVCTAPQAHLLTPTLARRSLRNAYHRLATLVRHNWLVMDAVAPTRGAATAHFYRPSHHALRVMKLDKKLGLIQRPAQHVLEYLLARAEVYARAVAAGWYVGSHIFLRPEHHDDALKRFNGYLKTRALDRLNKAQAKRLAPAQLLELNTALAQLPHFLPKELNFEFLYKIDAGTKHTTGVALLLVDDVRRSVSSQVDALPLVAKLDCSVMIRDCDSVFNPDTQSLHFTGTRLGELRRAVAARFGDAFVGTDTHLPNVWARSTRPAQHEASASPTSSTNPKEHSP